MELDGQGDGALRRVFDGVVQQIDQDLLDAHLIPVQLGGDALLHVDMEVQSLFPGPHPDHVHDVGQHVSRVVVDGDDIHFSALDLGHIQNIVDQGQQHLAGVLDVLRVLRHLVGYGLPQDHLVQADDGVDGSADLVAHAGKEPVLRLDQFLDLLLLLLGLLIFHLVLRALEEQHTADHKGYDDECYQGIDVRHLQRVLDDLLRVEIGGVIAEQGHRAASGQQHILGPSLHDKRDQHKPQDEPDGAAPVDPSRREEIQRQHHEQDDGRYDDGSPLDPMTAEREIDGGRKKRKRYEHGDLIEGILPRQTAYDAAQRQAHQPGKGDQPKHPLLQGGIDIPRYLSK